MDPTFVQKWRDYARHAELEASILRRHDPTHAPSVRAYQLAAAHALGMHVVLDALASAQTVTEFLDQVDSRTPELGHALQTVNSPYRKHAESRLKTSVSVLVSDLSRQI